MRDTFIGHNQLLHSFLFKFEEIIPLVCGRKNYVNMENGRKWQSGLQYGHSSTSFLCQQYKYWSTDWDETWDLGWTRFWTWLVIMQRFELLFPPWFNLLFTPAYVPWYRRFGQGTNFQVKLSLGYFAAYISWRKKMWINREKIHVLFTFLQFTIWI